MRISLLSFLSSILLIVMVGCTSIGDYTDKSVWDFDAAKARLAKHPLPDMIFLFMDKAKFTELEFVKYVKKYAKGRKITWILGIDMFGKRTIRCAIIEKGEDNANDSMREKDIWTAPQNLRKGKSRVHIPRHEE